MKYLKHLLILLSTTTLLYGAESNQPGPTLETVKIAAQTNLNQVMIEILSGVKTAGSEIYDASKSALKKSVDFVSEQAPGCSKAVFEVEDDRSYNLVGFYDYS
jgi:hypothetical protein